MGTVVLLNGEVLPAGSARISVFDHGLLYGDGVFEGIRAYNGRVFKLKEHVERLYRSAKAITLSIPLRIISVLTPPAGLGMSWGRAGPGR